MPGVDPGIDTGTVYRTRGGPGGGAHLINTLSYQYFLSRKGKLKLDKKHFALLEKEIKNCFLRSTSNFSVRKMWYKNDQAVH